MENSRNRIRMQSCTWKRLQSRRGLATDCMEVHWLGLCTLSAGAMDSTPGGETKILPAMRLVLCVHAQLCLTLWDPMDCRLPGFSVHGISQVRILEWTAISYFRGSSRPRDWPNLEKNWPQIKHWRAVQLYFSFYFLNDTECQAKDFIL